MKEPIILYSSSGCLRCRLIKLMLESHNVEYIEVKDNKQLMIERGFESAPVLEVDGKVIGFVNVGSTDEKEYDNCGELHAIYIINGYKGNGFGKKLINIGIEELKKMGYNKMIIGCLEGNPSNEFYKHIGGEFIKKRVFKKLNLPENVYYFNKI